jgi:diacylglycerol kinase (ATP)
MRKRALLILNPRSRRGRAEHKAVRAQLHECGFDLIEPNTKHGRQISPAIRGLRAQVDLVIVGGGDGTLNAAVDGLVEAQLPLGILPLGTANDLARTLKLPADLPSACKIIADGYTKRIDLGLVNGKYFFNVASLGLSVEICRRLSRKQKNRWGVLAYLLTALRVLWSSRPFHAEIRANGEKIRVKTVQIAVGNGCYYGGGMAVDKEARLDDQLLHLYSLEIKRWWQILFLLPAMRTGTLSRSSYARTLQGAEFDIIPRKRRPINTDGEITTSTPGKFRVIPRALAVFAPPDADTTCSPNPLPQSG